MHKPQAMVGQASSAGRLVTLAGILLTVLLLVGCQPSDQTPGQWLRGEAAESLPTDWTFSDAYPEIQLEVQTPYLIPHSVTIWCAHVNGELYIGARDAQSKKWPGWLASNPHIRLKIGATLYAVKAVDIDEDSQLAAVSAAYENKYSIGPPADGKPRQVKYWQIAAR